MTTLYAITSLALGIGIVALFFYNLVVQKVDALSMRNLFLLGFLHFFCLGGYFHVTVGNFAHRAVTSERALVILLFLSILFLSAFFAAFALFYKKTWMQRFVPTFPLPVTSPCIIISIAALSLFALASSFAPNNFLGLFLVQFRSGLSAAAVALATYYVLASKFNPLSWIIFVAALGVAIVASTVGGSGRRGLVAVLIAIPWMWYYFSLRYKNPGVTAVKIGALGAAGLILVAGYGAYRQKGGEEQAGGVTAQVRTEQFTEILSAGVADRDHFLRILYTDTVGNTLFIIENYPSEYRYTPLSGLKWFFGNPIPRVIWYNKPEALGVILQTQMGTEANLGPGIIGHGWAELSFLGVLYYGAFFGALTAVCDRTIRWNLHNPFLLAIMTAGGGNMIAMVRGDTPLFLLQVTAAVVASGGTLYLIKWTVGPIVRAFPPLLVPDIVHAFQEPEDDEFSQDYQD